MNTNNQQRHKSEAPNTSHASHSNPNMPPNNQARRYSAEPVEVDTRGQRQRTRQYIQEKDAELNRIKAEYPDHVKHKAYKQPPANKNGARMLLTLVLAVFLFFALSLLAVFGIAVAVKNATVPNNEGADTQQGILDIQTDTYNSPSDTDAATETEEEPVVEPVSVYASATQSTVSLSDEVGSTNAIMIDLSDYTILAQKGADERIYPASMTKIMTLLVGVENMTSLDKKATVTKQTYDYCYKEGASVVGFLANEEVTISDLLYGTILPSGADATMTLAECIAGSEEAFVKLMNSKAAELGLEHTHFVNTSGLHHPDHYSTVHDIAIILKAAMANETCFKILSANHYVTSQTTQHQNGIPLYSIVHSRTSSIKSTDFTIIGGKTGFTPEAGQCLATYAIAEGNREYIFVTANATDRSIPVKDAEYAYTTYIKAKDTQA